MIFSIEIDPQVYLELEDSILYYETKQTGLGIKFLEYWEASIEYLAKHPYSLQRVFKEHRQISLDKFPYLLIYKIEGKKVLVYRLINSKKHPGKRYKE